MLVLLKTARIPLFHVEISQKQNDKATTVTMLNRVLQKIEAQ
jgi:hypothetical protein